MTHEDLLYYQLIGDLALISLAKILSTHCFEVYSYLRGHMTQTQCLTLFVVGLGLDTVMQSYILDISLVR